MTTHRQDTGYDAVRYQPDASRSLVWREIIRVLSEYLPKDPAVLELGPGYCDFINQVPARKKVAVDVDPASAKCAASDVEFILGDCTDITPIAPSSMDLVFASNLLEHLERRDATRMLTSVFQVLRPGGKFILIQPNFRYSYSRYYDDHTHLTPYTHTGLGGLVRSEGFRIVACTPRFMPMSMSDCSWIPRYGWLVRLYLRLPVRPLARQMLLVAEKPSGG